MIMRVEHFCEAMAKATGDPLANETKIVFDNYRGHWMIVTDGNPQKRAVLDLDGYRKDLRRRMEIEFGSLNKVVSSISFCPYCGAHLDAPDPDAGSEEPAKERSEG